MTLVQALQVAHALGVDRLEAQGLLLHVLGRRPGDRAWLLAHDTDELSPVQADRLTALAARRAGHEPLAYLTGQQAFYGLDLHVDARVLVPRPDTETLVDWALDLGIGIGIGRLDVLDLGTGSGAVALALQNARPDWRVWATDASQEALAVAKGNAMRLNLDVHFLHGNWFEALIFGDALPFDLIVSNPPYIAEGDVHLSALQHEPAQALTSGADGLNDIRHIVARASAHLVPGGWLLLEHGYNQAAQVCDLLLQAGFGNVQYRRDLAGVARCSSGQLPPQVSS